MSNTSPGGYNAGFIDSLAHDYLYLTTQYPDVILPRCRQRWEAGLYRISISFYGDDGPHINSNDPGQFYPNVQGRHMGCVFFTSLALTGPNSTYGNSGFPYYGTVPANHPADATPAQMKALAYTYLTVANKPSSQFADGGSTYVDGYPPVSTYYGAELQTVAYIRQTVRGSSASDDVTATSTAASSCNGPGSTCRSIFPTTAPISTRARFTPTSKEVLTSRHPGPQSSRSTPT